MPVRVTLDDVLHLRRMTAKQVCERIGISETQLSLFRSGKVRGLRFVTLAKLCHVLDCTPGDILDYDRNDEDLDGPSDDTVA